MSSAYSLHNQFKFPAAQAGTQKFARTAKSKIEIESFVLFLISLSIIFVVPSIPGAVFAKYLSVALAALLVVGCRPLAKWPKPSLYYTLSGLGLLTFIIISYFSLVASATDQTVDKQTSNLFATLAVGSLSILAARVVNGYKYVNQFFRVLLWVCAIPCFSLCITLMLGAIGSEDISYIGEIFHDPVHHQRWDLYLPLTITSGKIQWLGRSLPRFCGISREPGIFQYYLIICLGVIDLVEIRFRFILKCLYLLGLALTFSTIGLPLCVLIYAYIALTSNKLPRTVRVIVCLLVLAAIPPILSFGPLSTTDKLENLAHRDRDNSRTVPVILSYQAFKENPWFGYGVFSTDALSIRSEGISLLAALHKFGIVGLILILGTWAVGLKNFYTRRSFAVIAPLLITAITAQPVFLSGMMFFMMGLDTKQIRNEQ